MNMPSLLPYLNPGNNSPRLNIPRISPQDTTGGQVRFPFALISGKGPFTRIIQAQIESDSGSIIKPVFLMCEAQEYHAVNEEPGMVNNVEIENSWQLAYEKYSPENSIITLADQMGEDGRIRQFGSLFYCGYRETFFHPPCPNCGSPLMLCKDDDLLTSAGLAPYSQSMRRYLYCEQCSVNSTGSEFYAYMPESTDPDAVKDLHHLIKGFGRLKGGDIAHFPCALCTSHDECYGNKDLAHSRIQPFSFYPFHLFILDAASINAFDFLSLMSGATLHELEDRLSRNSLTGRIPYVESVSRRMLQGSSFLFEKDDRHFLELLYLKLTFLGQLARLVFSDTDSYRHSYPGFRLDRAWVSLTQEHSLLPFFWNFHTSLIDIVGSTSSPQLHAAMPPLYANYVLGMLWFSVLLGNKDLGPSQVNKMLAKCSQRDDALNMTIAEEYMPNEYSHAFTPGNIYWNTGELSLPEEWTSLWVNALSLGWALLKSSSAGDSTLLEDDFWKAFDGLREEIRNTLFKPGSPAAAEKADATGNYEIHEILSRIISKWSAQTVAKEKELEETVLLSGGTAGRSQPVQDFEEEQEKTLFLKESPDTAPDSEYNDDEDVLETIILSSDEVTVEHEQKIDGDIDETVMMKPGEIVPGIHGSGPQPPGPDVQTQETPRGLKEDLEETVLLNPDNKPEPVHSRPGGGDLHHGGPAQPPSPHKQEVPQSPAGDGGLDETVILHSNAGDETIIMNPDQEVSEPSDTSGRGEMPGSADEEDLLTETIILKPGNDKG